MPVGKPPGGASGGPEGAATSADELGRALTAARDTAGKSIEQVAAATRIRGTLIRSMEAGNFAPCGGHVYARGHLRSIAAALGVDGEQFVADYDAFSGQTDTQVRTASLGALETDVGALRGLGGNRVRAVSTWLIAAVGAAAVFAIVLGVSLIHGGGTNNDNNVTAKGLPSASVSGGAPRPTSGATVAPTAPQTVAYAGVNVTVNVGSSASWVHVVDQAGTLVFQGTLTPGESKQFHATQRLRFIFGYAPAIDLVVNGKSIGQPPASASQVSTVSIDTNTATTGQLG